MSRTHATCASYGNYGYLAGTSAVADRANVAHMSLGDFVRCFCKKCGGGSQPRSTRDGHYAQDRRRASRQRPAKLKDLRHEQVLARLRSTYGRVKLHGSPASQFTGTLTSEDIVLPDECQTMESQGDAGPSRAVAVPPLMGGHAGDGPWASIATPRLPPSSHWQPSPSLADVSLPLLPSAPGHASELCNGEDVPLVRSETYDDPEAIGDDEWVDDDVGDDTGVEPLPPVAQSPTDFTEGLPPHTYAPPDMLASTPSGATSTHGTRPGAHGAYIPLNADAMSSLTQVEVRGTATAVVGGVSEGEL
ncbi:hypothetical protein C8Q77DRAFT_1134230 [Trametes polyzona]|nr:hypothetical protein C8Q77DRAFT_1134230 [Trametes polyzona]